MAVSRKTFQYQTSISLNRDSFLNLVVKNDELPKKTLRVLLHLLCHLDSKIPKEISIKNMASDLGISKSDVKASLELLEMMHLIQYITTGSVENGLVVTF